MRIGIDGGALSITDDRLKVGVYRVAYNLVKEIQALDVKNDYRVYSFGRGERGTHELSQPNTHFVRLPQPGYQKIWQTADIITHPIDVYLGISQSLPWVPDILCDVKNVGFIYDVGFLEYPEFYPRSAGSLSRQTAALVANSSHIITISHASKSAIQRAYHVADNRVSVAYLGVDAAFTDHGPVRLLPHPYFLCVGALKPGKNIPFMLRAFADFLSQTNASYEFVLIGSDYWLDPGIPETIEELGLGHTVRVLGYVPDAELAQYYRGAAALLAVSHIEGFGLPAAEAMACGCPVIASTSGSYTEVVGSAGICVDPKDRQAVVGAMRRMAEDNAFRKTAGEKGKKQAATFSWRRFGRSVLSVCSRVYSSNL